MTACSMDEEAKKVLCISLGDEKIFPDILDENIVGSYVIKRFVALFHRTLDFSTVSSAVLADAETLLLYAWQELNTGKWSDVNVNWHKLYAAVSWLKAVSTIRCRTSEDMNVWSDVVKICDMGHLMGGDVWDGILIRTISAAERLISTNDCSQTAEEPPSKKIRAIAAVCDVHHPIGEVELPSLIDFRNNFLRKKKPIVLKKCLENWPALKKWSPEYVRKVCGSRTVPVEIGKRYTDADWGQELMTINNFINKFIFMIGNPEKKIAYLAQHDFFTQAPILQKDVFVPDYVFFCGNEEPEINAWFGPCATVSPLHFDPKNNLFCQVFGEKYVRLYEESQTEFLYPHEGKMLSNTSQIDVENPNFDKFPKFSKAVFSDFILRPGDCLFIPSRCWHYVRSLSISFSVSFWFSESP